MNRISQYLIAGFSMTAMFVSGACGDDNDNNIPTIDVVGGLTSVTGLNSAGQKVTIPLVIQADDGFQNLKITSDKGFDQTITDGDEDFELNFDYDLAGKTPGAEKFTFTVTDVDGDTDSVQVTVNIKVPADNYTVNFDGGYELGDDNNAFINLLTGDTYSYNEINADLAGLLPLVDAYFDVFDVLVEFNTPGGEKTKIEIQAFGNAARTTTYKAITEAQFASVDTEDSEAERAALIDSLYNDNGNAETTFFSIIFTENAYAFKTESGNIGVINFADYMQGDQPLSLDAEVWINP